MRPAARLAALIELLTEVEEGIASGGAPADSITNQYFRKRRYAGSKDRRDISDNLFAILRQRELLLWCLAECGQQASANVLVLAYCATSRPDLLPLYGEGGDYGPAELTDTEKVIVGKLQAPELSRAPETAKYNVPMWALEGFQARFGDAWLEHAEALNATAPLDLRVNSLKAKRSSMLASQLNGFEVTRLSPLGYRSTKNVALGGLQPYKKGLVEVQDEAAQIASHLVAAKPGMQVADLCAGAGGKSLAIAGLMQNKGRLVACDIHQRRLDECKKRAKRAGASIIKTNVLAVDAKKRSEQIQNWKNQFDRVFVDVPCTGTGTWRRSPDQRWRYDSKQLAELNELQAQLLQESADLVKPDGRLLYMTCSILPQENEHIVETFLEAYPDWQLMDYRELWQQELASEPVETDSTNPLCLQLNPHSHETDGFFVAVFTHA